MINRWLILIDGFTKQKGEPTGFDSIFRKVHDDCPGWRVDQYEWDADWKEEANWIKRHLAPAGHVVIAAYSWGAGYGAKHLSEALERLGIGVSFMVLCDPVYRNPLFPHWWVALPSSMTSGRKIHYPLTVRNLEWFFQRQNKPAGHEPVGARNISAGVQLHRDHCDMEDAPEFHAAVYRVVELLSGP